MKRGGSGRFVFLPRRWGARIAAAATNLPWILTATMKTLSDCCLWRHLWDLSIGNRALRGDISAYRFGCS